MRRLRSIEVAGSVVAVRGLSVLVQYLPLPVGSLVRFEGPARRNSMATESIRGEVVGFDGDHAVVMLFSGSAGIAPGWRVIGEQSAQTLPVGDCLLGRILDGMGEPIDGGRPLADTTLRPLDPAPTGALTRRRIDEPLPTGVAAIDAMVTLGKGQRIGIFSGPGVGKSTLVASIARHTSADVNVIALIGERGREVRDFLESALGPEGLARSVVIVATGDESPLLRVRAAMVACTAAEYFRDLGADVMLMMDSITRFAQAQRQIGLTVGEQPATKGYTPSVFAMMPRLLERAGALTSGGSITGLYAVLVEGDDLNEPISDAARGILDGHIALSRKLASRGHYPAIDLLESISRVANDVCDQHHVQARRTMVRLLSAYSESEELINIGAYARGSNPDCDVAIALKPRIDQFLQQSSSEPASYPMICRQLIELAAEANDLRTKIERAAPAASPNPITNTQNRGGSKAS
ncbi:MAG: FliI/YscN family ATPase [Phycisphaerales bacterium]|nr:MAG: FliI/YscN family ATPase [Phycisphaerales bacterium]